MWIKWKYNDHGHPDFQEMELPKWMKEAYGTVENCLCERELVPIHSERFDPVRIEWKKLSRPTKKHLRAEITRLENEIETRQLKLSEYKSLLIYH